MNASQSVIAGLMGWVGLLSLCRFLWTKIAFNTEATGWILLPVFAICVVVVVCLRLSRGERIIGCAPLIWVSAFLFYFLLRLALDSSQVSDFLGYTVGYSNGVLFAYGLGLAVRNLIESVSMAFRPTFRYLACALFLVINIAEAIDLGTSATAGERMHRELLLINNPNYQVSGFLISAMALIVTCVVALCMQTSLGKRSFGRWILIVLVAAYFSSTAALSQLLGSNAGPAFIGPLGIFCIAILLLPHVAWMTSHPRKLKAYQLGYQFSFFRLLIQWGFRVAALGLLTVTTLWLVIDAGWIDISRLRIFNFSENITANESAVSRLNILERNFMVQFWHSPLFGNMFVDRLTTGDGSYLHSLLAISTHLGAIGSLIFLGLGFSIVMQLKGFWRKSQASFSAAFILLSVITLTWVTLFTLAANFFTAIQFWMALALFAPAVRVFKFKAAESGVDK